MFPAIEPSEVGLTGLLWLFLSYGYVLYFASNMISEGSELLLLVPSMAGLVGGVVLPLLGAVPDGAIILFSGIGSMETAQETLSVGVGALAGSTIMLLTVPFAVSILAGRVDIDEQGNAAYKKKPKLSEKNSIIASFTSSGVSITDAVKHGGVIMVITTIPYFLIQVPALFMHGPSEEIAEGERWWSFSGMIVCLVGLVAYMRLQLKISKEGEDKGKRIAVMKKMLTKGKLSLSGALMANVREMTELERSAATEYQAIQQNDQTNDLYPPPKIAAYLKDVLHDAFLSYDENRNGVLDTREVYTFFRDFHENISEEEMDNMFKKYDRDGDGTISFDEFIGLAYVLIMNSESREELSAPARKSKTEEVAKSIMENDDAAEEEEVPEEFADLSPDEQQAAIKKEAFITLGIGTLLVILFSDPMVDVMQEIAVRANISAFYVSFILAPLASNASEVIASQYYAAKKTRKTITVSLTALEGAASMNNTFCLSIFMGLVFFRGLAWQYTAETTSIVVVEFFMAWIVQRESLSGVHALIILAIFPLSLVIVAVLEAFGFD